MIGLHCISISAGIWSTDLLKTEYDILCLCPLAYRIDISLLISLYDKQLKSKRLNG